MRIIAGQYGRRRFNVPKNFQLRPTTDIAKEALFNTLESAISLDGLRALDLFAGTGSIGFEFLSRGAREVMWVDLHPKHCAFIKDVIRQLDPDAKTSVIRSNVKAFFEKIAPTEAPFDVIFADPPYSLDWLLLLPEMIMNSGLMTPSTLLIVEHPSTCDLSSIRGFQRHKQYSAVNYSFFQI